MKRILVDMDGVLADVCTYCIKLYEEETGIRKTPEELEGIDESESFPNVHKWVSGPGFFRSLPVIPHSQRVLKLLNEKYEIFIVSLATEYPLSLTEKQLWLNEHFPFISWKQVILCGNKSVVPADIMIDDHLKNLNFFKGETIMFLQPHNMKKKDHSHKTVSSWLEIENMLL
jgi:5'-nucleotidase